MLISKALRNIYYILYQGVLLGAFLLYIVIKSKNKSVA